MDDVKEKRCPFRVLKAEHPAMLRGHGSTVTEEFYQCMGEECAAYYRGICLRLQPPFSVADREMTDEERQQILEYIRNSPVVPLSTFDQKGEIPW